MIRGISGVVTAADTVPGQFYLQTRYNEAPILVMRVDLALAERSPAALAFEPDGDASQQIQLIELDDSLPLVAMPPVYLRIDPPSVIGSAFTVSRRIGMLMVAGDRPYILAPFRFRGSALIDLMTGEPVDGRGPDNWVAFERWLLVVDEAGEEIPIAAFGESASA